MFKSQNTSDRSVAQIPNGSPTYRLPPLFLRRRDRFSPDTGFHTKGILKLQAFVHWLVLKQQISRYSDTLQAERSGNRIPVQTRLSAGV